MREVWDARDELVLARDGELPDGNHGGGAMEVFGAGLIGTRRGRTDSGGEKWSEEDSAEERSGRRRGL